MYEFDVTKEPRVPLFRSSPLFDSSDAWESTNFYGSKVLTSTDIFIADVDIEGDLFERNEFKSNYLKDTFYPLAADLSDKYQFVVYETFKGFRIFEIKNLYDPLGEESKNLLDLLGADTKYSAKCIEQGCYRARVSPKPYRLGLPKPRDYLYQDEWDKQYEILKKDRTTCKPLFDWKDIEDIVHPKVREFLKLHDELACNGDLEFG